MNSVRVYEQFDFSWWTPFWDREYLEFWEAVPYNMRKDRKLQLGHIRELSSECGLEADDLGNASDPSLVARAAKFTLKHGPRWIWEAVRTRRKKSIWSRHALNPYWFYDFDYVEECRKTGYELNGIFAKRILREMSR